MLSDAQITQIRERHEAGYYDGAATGAFAISGLLATVDRLRSELDEALEHHGMESGFWGRAAARATKKRREAEAAYARLRTALEAAHGQIINLPVRGSVLTADVSYQNAYRVGHRDARHDAAELVGALVFPEDGAGVTKEETKAESSQR